MPFAVHTEELNFVCAIAEEVSDEAACATAAAQRNGHAQQQQPLLPPMMTPGTWASHCHELYAVGHLAIPTVIIQMGGVLPGFCTASYIGRNFDVEHLDGFTLASLTFNLFVLSLLQGLYSASDTLSPQAYGAGNAAEVGHLAVRGYIGSLIVTGPLIIILAVTMKSILIGIGIDPIAARHAWHYYLVNIISMPFTALYQVTWKFLSAQNVMKPLLVSILLACGVVLPIALLTLGETYGFLGTALANVVFQISLSLSLLLYLRIFQPHDPATWPGLRIAIKQAIRWEPFRKYMILGCGGMLASSEWIYWESLSLIIGTLGVIPLSVHTIPTQLLTVTFMLPLGLGIALSIRLGATLPISVVRAKQVVVDCLFLGTVVFGGLSILMFTQRRDIFRLFTTSELVLAGCEEIWWKVCFYLFQLSIFGILMGTCVGLGMQWTLGITAIVALWVLGLPASYYVAVIRGGGLNGAWSTIWPPYVLINVALTVAIIRADWNAIAKDIRIREGPELVARRLSSSGRETSSLLISEYGSIS